MTGRVAGTRYLPKRLNFPRLLFLGMRLKQWCRSSAPRRPWGLYNLGVWNDDDRKWFELALMHLGKIADDDYVVKPNCETSSMYLSSNRICFGLVYLFYFDGD